MPDAGPRAPRNSVPSVRDDAPTRDDVEENGAQTAVGDRSGVGLCLSGGSIVASHLAKSIHDRASGRHGYTSQEWETRVAAPLRKFAKRNIRFWPLVKRLLPWNLPFSATSVLQLQKCYERLTEGIELSQLPERPRFIFCATDMVFTKSWESGRGRVGDYLAGYVPPPDDWTVGKAVAASSCFPPLFAPMPTGIPGAEYKRRGDRTGTIEQQNRRRDAIRLTDGGVYDNLGTEPVWKSHAVVLVSDAGLAHSALGNSHKRRWLGRFG